MFVLFQFYFSFISDVTTALIAKLQRDSCNSCSVWCVVVRWISEDASGEDLAQYSDGEGRRWMDGSRWVPCQEWPLSRYLSHSLTEHFIHMYTVLSDVTCPYIVASLLSVFWRVVWTFRWIVCKMKKSVSFTWCHHIYIYASMHTYICVQVYIKMYTCSEVKASVLWASNKLGEWLTDRVSMRFSPWVSSAMEVATEIKFGT